MSADEPPAPPNNAFLQRRVRWGSEHKPPPDPQPAATPEPQHNDTPFDPAVTANGSRINDLPLVVSWFSTGIPKEKGPAIGDPEHTTWGNFVEILRQRREGEKDGPCFVPARFKLEPDGKHVCRRGVNLIARTLIPLDIETNKKTLERPPSLDTAAARVRDAGWAAVLYTSYNHTIEAPRYRIVPLLAEEIDHELPAVEAVADKLGLARVFDRSKRGTNSLFYAPSASPGELDRHQTVVIDGAPIDAAWLTQAAGKLLAERQVEQDRIAAEERAQAEARRQAKIAAGYDPDDSLIEKIRDRLDLEHILLTHGYDKDKRSGKFRHPNSESGSYGADIKSFGGIERIYSFNGNDPLHRDNLPAWCNVAAVDAFDAAVILEFGGDRTRALRELAERFGFGKARERHQDGRGKSNGEDIPPSGVIPPDGKNDYDSSTSWASPPPEEPWPEIEAEAFHGLAGRLVDAIAPHTEADPVGLLLHYLCMVGNVIGRKPYYPVGQTRHYPVLNALTVGKTARARKGTARHELTPLFELAEPDWTQHCQHSGLSSGEGLITCVHDEITVREKMKGNPPRYTTVVKEEAVKDKRATVIETEFGGRLIVMSRDGNSLSQIIREFWDCQHVVQKKVKNSPTKATDAHVSIIGHITISELRRRLDFSLFANGFVNRFLLALVKRAQILPFGGEPDRESIAELARRTHQATERARQGIVRIGFSTAGRERWKIAYENLSRDLVGLVDDALARAEAQTARLAMVYCLLDCQVDITPEHIEAALAVWRYCEASTRYLFGDRTGDPIADEILAALRQVAPDFMTRTEIYNLLGRNRSSERTGEALGLLLRHGKVRRGQRATSGRSVEIWAAA